LGQLILGQATFFNGSERESVKNPSSLSAMTTHPIDSGKTVVLVYTPYTKYG